jgi:putative flippase GtrA
VTSRASTTLPRVPATFVRYLAAGVLAYVVDTGTLWLLYTVAGAPLWLAATAGFWLSFAVNFTAQKYFTFGVRSDSRRQVLRFAALVGANYLATLALVGGLVGLGTSVLVGKTISVALLMVVNYFAYRLWVFRG